jgi:hypothetical protein
MIPVYTNTSHHRKTENFTIADGRITGSQVNLSARLGCGLTCVMYQKRIIWLVSTVSQEGYTMGKMGSCVFSGRIIPLACKLSKKTIYFSVNIF